VGRRLVLGQAVAGRDPEAFDRPDELDLAREPNEHLAFGLGIHYCLGAPLARLEAQVALPVLAKLLSRLRVAEAKLHWQPVMLSRGLVSLPVTRR
jgi:cytochrome P450